MNRIPDNEFTEFEAGHFPSLDSAYEAELKYYRQVPCPKCGEIINVKIGEPCRKYECRKHHRFEAVAL